MTIKMVPELRKLSERIETVKKMDKLFADNKEKEASSRVLEHLLGHGRWQKILRKAALSGYTFADLELKVTESDAKLVVDYFEKEGFISFVKGRQGDFFNILVDWKEREYSDECSQE